MKSNFIKKFIKVKVNNVIDYMDTEISKFKVTISNIMIIIDR